MAEGHPVSWLTAFLDLPAERFEGGAAFWCAATGSGLSPLRGDSSQFATLLPPAGAACWRVQRLEDGGPGMHLDLHTDAPAALVASVTASGAVVVEVLDDVTVLRSPAGLPFCVVGDEGDGGPRPAPVDWGGHTSLLDQVCLDVPRDGLATEVAFWAGVLGAEPSRSTRRAEFTNLRRPDHLPLRLLFQDTGPFETPPRSSGAPQGPGPVEMVPEEPRDEASRRTPPRSSEAPQGPGPFEMVPEEPRDEASRRTPPRSSGAPQGPGPVGAHPDLATTDRAAEVERLVAAGAVVEVVEQFWTVLRAPDERLFCVTERDPATGQLN